ncbi:hypothetical protein BEL04_05395 [Mucilaginibacter sp. PPCGB 2223]|uniref:Crp/Fnr family transcriptional regulator n=1 Tax=Mucilaginibacter sp. PPCGB 2223 TaxID=1886027 RepID=UPI00082661ED|nr:Crp/Fnr family transcriptional regulator [Mucilaginibacter sp. PPCGB 2223]OCX53726.1 hypothetical protein BEL04_05395 [Mucilaginibacter sp. PPCGB 2223]
MEQLIRYVQQVLPLSPAKATALVARFKPVVFEKNSYLLQAGQICNTYYFIETGILRAYAYDLEGNEVTTAFFSENSFASDLLSFFQREPSREYIQALSDCRTWALSYDDMQENFHSLPEFREFGRLKIVASYGQLKGRMLSMLQETAEERYAGLLKNSPGLFRQVPLKYIASYLGITDSTLSRLRKASVKK